MLPFSRILEYGNILPPDIWDNNPNVLSGSGSLVGTSNIFGQNGPRGCAYHNQIYFSGVTGSIMYINAETDARTVITTRPVQARNIGICTNGIDIYCIGGYVNSTGSGTNRMDKYNIATNTWSTTPNFPLTTWSIGAAFDWVNNIIYVMASNGNGFRKYNISTATWSTVTMPTYSFTWSQPSLLYDSGYIYCMLDSNFVRYNVSTSEWVTLATLNDISTAGNKYTQISVMGANIYAVTNAVAGLWKYSIASNSWSRINTTIPIRDQEPTIGCGYKTAYSVSGTNIYKFT